MKALIRIGMLISALTVMAACAAPRGVGVDREILRGADNEDANFSVVPVTRAMLSEIGRWAATGRAGYHWLSSGGGPGSAILRAGDFVDIVIWDTQENSLLATVGEKRTAMEGLTIAADGTVFIPYVGDVVISGMTESQARKEIQERLSSIAPSAQVQLTAKAGAANTVDMVSGMSKPGRYPLTSRSVTILSMVAESGGISETLRNPLVRLIRSGKTYEIRSDDLFSRASANITMRGGDKVVVEEDERYFVGFGATGSEQLVPFDRERIAALEAVTMLGGLDDNRANPKGVLVLRQYPASAVKPRRSHGPDKGDVIFTFDLTSADGLFAARNFQVNPGDTVIATESPLISTVAVISLVSSLVSLKNNL